MSDEKIGIYPGTFDPITLGHIDIIERASRLFDRVIVTLAINQTKKPLFTESERIDMIKNACEKFSNVSVDKFDGLLVNFAKEQKAIGIIRGLRAVSDFEYEFQMALMNRQLAQNITTVFLMPNEKYTYLNSTIVKDVARFGGNVEKFVTNYVSDKLIDKMKV